MIFFEAVNEFGKDFESIQHYINAKLKKKNSTDEQMRTKDHGKSTTKQDLVREFFCVLFYLSTWQNNKVVKKNTFKLEQGFKFKLHILVRSFFIRTFHEVAKHVKFSENVKKIVQELYGVINYGELYRKLGVVSDKTLMKLNELIYRGETCVRTKGTYNNLFGKQF